MLFASTVSVIAFLPIVSIPSTITNLTLLKLILVFVKSAAVRFISYVPAFVPLMLSFPLKLKSFVV